MVKLRACRSCRREFRSEDAGENSARSRVRLHCAEDVAAGHLSTAALLERAGKLRWKDNSGPGAAVLSAPPLDQYRPGDRRAARDVLRAHPRSFAGDVLR